MKISLLFLFIFIVIVILLSFVSKFTNVQQIPNVVHKIFISSEMEEIPIDNNIKVAMDTWTKLNPGYTLKKWYGNDCRKYLMDNFGQAHVNCFDNLIPYAYKADFMRYCIIYNEGGWYSDWQQILLVPLSKFKGYSWVSCWDTTGDENRINGCMQNGFFGACKNNNILKECINKCIDNYSQKNYGKSPWYPTGPCLLGDAFRKINPSSGIKLGFTQTDPVDGPCFVIDSIKTIINKCCSDINKPGSEFKNGNNYYTLWTNKSIYK